MIKSFADQISFSIEPKENMFLSSFTSAVFISILKGNINYKKSIYINSISIFSSFNSSNSLHQEILNLQQNERRSTENKGQISSWPLPASLVTPIFDRPLLNHIFSPNSDFGFASLYCKLTWSIEVELCVSYLLLLFFSNSALFIVLFKLKLNV